jgi:hypothetical protein
MMRSLAPALLLLAACGSSSPALPAGTTVIDWRVGATGLAHTVQVGQSVAWRSVDEMGHTATSGSSPAAFAEVEVPSGQTSAAVRFDTVGDYPYFCSIHGAKVQNGTVHVVAASGGGGGHGY